MGPIDDARKQLELLDDELVDLLARRLAVVRGIFAAKRAAGAPLVDVAREEFVVERAARRGEGVGLPAPEVRAVLRAVLALSRREAGEPLGGGA